MALTIGSSRAKVKPSSGGVVSSIVPAAPGQAQSSNAFSGHGSTNRWTVSCNIMLQRNALEGILTDPNGSQGDPVAPMRHAGTLKLLLRQVRQPFALTEAGLKICKQPGMGPKNP